eukprot:38561-Lingulodinium_polyedra.AAC.1
MRQYATRTHKCGTVTTSQTRFLIARLWILKAVRESATVAHSFRSVREPATVLAAASMKISTWTSFGQLLA